MTIQNGTEQRYTFKSESREQAFRLLHGQSLLGLCSILLTNYLKTLNHWGGALLSVVNCSHFSIYWFFIPLFACYFSIPVLNRVTNKKEVFSYLIIYAFLSYSVLPYLNGLLGIAINPAIQAPVAGGYIIYLLLGYMLDHHPLRLSARVVLYVCGAIGLFLHCFMTITLSSEQGINPLYKGYLNFPCIFYSTAIFVFVRYTDWNFLLEKQILSRILKAICGCSLGVYLIHGWFVYYLVPYLGVNTASLAYRTIGAIIIFLCSMACTMVIKKCRILRYIV